MKSKEELNELSKVILDASIAVHREMGPGLLESVYHHCLAEELYLRKLNFAMQVPVSLVYKGRHLNKDYMIDLLIEEEIVIELKAIEGLLAIHEAQLISYLKLADKRLGFLINFNVLKLKYGFRRFVNNF